jgi:hypothetical protein
MFQKFSAREYPLRTADATTRQALNAVFSLVTRFAIADNRALGYN